ncbi:MAG: Rne/Rng family ribonuclease [Geobacter sp.]|nr:Rne/Rng family ribonuclease [Geobacter sp.]
MSRKMLINVMHPEESRVAIVEDGRLVELDVEVAGHEETRGNVYNGVVVRVEPGLQAAFVDIGTKKLGFLQMGEIHPDYWQWRDDVPEDQRKRRPRIQEILRRGQELLVQVEKGERDMKGPALTTYMSLPGRYMVLMPGSDSAGISRKVESEAERKNLKQMAVELEFPEGFGYIIRTEAEGKKKTELAKDLKYLLNLYDTIKKQAAEVKAPALIHRDANLVVRSIRDYFTDEIDEVLVDGKDTYKEARAFFKQTMPKYEKLVKLHVEKRPIFAKYQLEEQIEHIFEKRVPLKSGGSIVIDPTEALVSIDVNSGKSTGEKNVEDTAFRTNMEAAEEVARQLRLRDLGGLIVIDFIDMYDKKHRVDVEKCLKQALKLDKARVNVGRISDFGLLEMSRQRIKQTISEGSAQICPHCGGIGKVKSVEAMAISFVRKVLAAASKGNVSEVRGALPLDVAYYLLNRKKQELARIESDYDLEVTVKGKTSFLQNQMEIEILRREKAVEHEPEHVHEPKHIPAPEHVVEAGAEAPAEAGEAAEGKKKRKRRRKKKGAETEAVEAAETTEAIEEAETGEETEEPEAAEIPEEPHSAEEAGEHKKKRRRRRRKKKHPGEEGAAPAEAPTAEAAEEVAPVMPEAAEAEAAEEHKKKRKRKRKRGKKEEGTEIAPAGEVVETPAPTVTAPVEETPATPEEKPKKKRPAKRSKAAEAAPVELAPEAASEEKPAEKEKKPRPARKKKAVAEAPAESVEEPAKPKRRRKKTAAEAEPVEAAAAETKETAAKPKAKRAPRKKKEEAAE